MSTDSPWGQYLQHVLYLIFPRPMADSVIWSPRFSRLLFAIFSAFLSKLHYMTWQYLFWLQLRRNSNKTDGNVSSPRKYFCLHYQIISWLHHYNNCGEITKTRPVCGFFFPISNCKSMFFNWEKGYCKLDSTLLFSISYDLIYLIQIYMDCGKKIAWLSCSIWS